MSRTFTSNLKENIQYPFTLKIRILWSKNITEEREPHIKFFLVLVIPFYVLLALAVNLETSYHRGNGVDSTWLFNLFDGPCNTRKHVMII